MTRGRRLRAFALVAFFQTSGCVVEEPSPEPSGFPADLAALQGAGPLARLIEDMFAAQVAHATADVWCPSGLTGEAGRRFNCVGGTSDGFRLEIEVREQGDGSFRWAITEAAPIADGEGP